MASKNERAEGHLHPNKRVWLAGFGLQVSLAGSNAARGDCFGERSLMAAKLRRTLDVRLVTALVFGPRFFCGQYVLADSTDETSAEILAAFVLLDSHSVTQRYRAASFWCRLLLLFGRIDKGSVQLVLFQCCVFFGAVLWSCPSTTPPLLVR